MHHYGDPVLCSCSLDRLDCACFALCRPILGAVHPRYTPADRQLSPSNHLDSPVSLTSANRPRLELHSISSLSLFL